jgi:NADP-dependent 3-hydroxy acid dehydrogenase YdfG
MVQPDSYPLVGRVALLTGASSCLGRATTIGLDVAGADVARLARSEADLAKTAQQVDTAGRQSLAVPIDLADPNSILDAVAAAASRLGRITWW